MLKPAQGFFIPCILNKDYQIETFFPSAEYIIENAYIYSWECDIFLQMKSGYHYEIEQKVSRGDFRADFKKNVKHWQLANNKKELLTVPGTRLQKWLYPKQLDEFDYNIDELIINSRNENKLVWINSFINIRKNTIPNRFFYITPKGLLDIKEIPKYAGLLEYSEGKVEQIKPAPWLHKNKHNYDKILLGKYKWRYEDAKNQLDYLRETLNEFRDIYNNQDDLNQALLLKNTGP